MREQTRKNSAARVSSTEQDSVQERGERRRSGRVALVGLTTVALVAKGELAPRERNKISRGCGQLCGQLWGPESTLWSPESTHDHERPGAGSATRVLAISRLALSTAAAAMSND